MITVYDLMFLFSDSNNQRVVICDLANDDAVNVFDGRFIEMPSKYHNLEILSIDPIYDDPDCNGKIVLNVDSTGGC